MRRGFWFLAFLPFLPVAAGSLAPTGAQAGSLPPTLRHAVLQAASGAGPACAENGTYRFDSAGMEAQIGIDGLSVSSGDVSSPAWAARLSGFGRGEAATGVRPLELVDHADRVSLRYQGLAEWYRGTAVGLVQGFTVEQPPPGQGAVAIRLDIDSPAPGVPVADGRGVRFAMGAGRTLHYDGLTAYDSSGRALEATLASLDGALLIRVDDGDALYPLTVEPLIHLETKLLAYDGDTMDHFGNAVAISGETALIGAYWDTVGTTNREGSAYVFVRSGASWNLQAHLTPDVGQDNEQFGTSVAISGNTAVIGAPLDLSTPSGSLGSAYVFVRTGTSWTQQAHLSAADGSGGDTFGEDVAISGDTALVASACDDVGANANQGSVYVFVRSGATWSPQAQLQASDGAANSYFGTSLAIEGDTALIGAPYQIVGANAEQGAVYAFVRSGTSWTEQAQLTAADGAAGDGFGYSTALSGESALIGAPNDDVDDLVDRGSAYVFVRSGVSWSQEAQLAAADGADSDNFGFSVHLAGDTAIVGAPWDDVGANGNQGSAYLFVRSASSWSQEAQLVAAGAGANENFGCSLALGSDVALVGARYADVGAVVEQGSAHLFGVRPWLDLAAGAGSSSTSPAAGSDVYLTATIANLGPTSVAGVQSFASLPAGLTFVGATASVGTYTSADGLWDIGTLAPGVTASLWIRATVDLNAAGSTLHFTVEHTAIPDSNAANDTASITLKVPYYQLSRTSNGALDGWVLESTETSGSGGSLNAGAATLFVGDDAADRQYRAVLSFDTSALPDNAVVSSATLQLKPATGAGANPFTTHGTLYVDLMKGSFSANSALQAADFKAAATKAQAGTVGKTLVGGWYKSALSAAALPLVNKTGLTQLRLAFSRDDNDDHGADYLGLSSGNAAAAVRPVLVIKYKIP